MVADSQNIKKQLEILIMEHFRTNFTDFPNGKLKASESPDFVLDISPKNKIGIELTRLYFNDFYTLRNETSDNIGKEIVNKAREFFELNSPWKLFIKVSFSKETKVIREKELTLSVFIANAIREAVNVKKQGSFFSIYHTTGLPDEVEGIFMATHPVLTDSVWEVTGLPTNSFETSQIIRKLIEKKEEKLQLYQKKRLNQYWLIITADRLNNMQRAKFDNLIFNTGNFSRFQRIFLFDLLNARINQIF